MPNDAAGIIAPSNPIGSPASAPAAPPVENTTDSVPRETNNPINSLPQEKEPTKVEVVQPKKPTSLDALTKAAEKVNRNEADRTKREEAKAAEVKAAETAPPAKVADPVKAAEAPKATDQAKPTKIDAPEWLNNPKAREKWVGVDDDVKTEVQKRVQDLEKGHEKYKASAQKYDEIKEYDDLATQYGIKLKDGIANYVAIDRALQGNDPQKKLAAIEEVFKAAKVTPQDVVAYYTGKPPEQAVAQQSRQVMELQQEIRELRQQMQGVTTNIEQQHQQQVEQNLSQWAQDKPLAAQLAPQIAAHYQRGLSLDEAYAKSEAEFKEMALAAGFVIPQAAPITPPQDRILNGSKSITGAPSAGSQLATHKPSKSTKDAVAKAMAALGVS